MTATSATARKPKAAADGATTASSRMIE